MVRIVERCKNCDDERWLCGGMKSVFVCGNTMLFTSLERMAEVRGRFIFMFINVRGQNCFVRGNTLAQRV